LVARADGQIKRLIVGLEGILAPPFADNTLLMEPEIDSSVNVLTVIRLFFEAIS